MVGIKKTGLVVTAVVSLGVASCHELQAVISVALIIAKAIRALRRVSPIESIMSDNCCDVVLLPKFSAVGAPCGVYYETVMIQFLQFTHHVDFGAKVHAWQVFAMLVFENCDEPAGLGLPDQRFVARVL